MCFFESTSDADSKYIILFIMKTYKVTYNAVFKNYENLNYSKIDQYACWFISKFSAHFKSRIKYIEFSNG